MHDAVQWYGWLLADELHGTMGMVQLECSGALHIISNSASKVLAGDAGCGATGVESIISGSFCCSPLLIQWQALIQCL
jgi:hypothetical protein